MKERKKNARPDVGASERAKEPGQASRQGRASRNNDTTSPPPGQRVSDYLLCGQQNAVPLKHLKDLLHLDGRKVRLMIRTERLTGTPICEDSQSGYYLPILRERGYPVERGGTQSFGQRPDLYGMEGVHLEIKRTENAKIWEWMQQSKEDAARFGDGWPTVIFRRSRSDWLICMQLSDWLTLYEMAHKCQCGGACSSAKTGEKRK